MNDREPQQINAKDPKNNDNYKIDESSNENANEIVHENSEINEEL